MLSNNCSPLTFLKKSCSLGLERWFATRLHNSKRFWSICTKFSGLACLDMKNICGKFRCKQIRMRKVIPLLFEWRMYASFRILCIWTYEANMHSSAPKVLMIVLPRFRDDYPFYESIFCWYLLVKHLSKHWSWICAFLCSLSNCFIFAISLNVPMCCFQYPSRQTCQFHSWLFVLYWTW